MSATVSLGIAVVRVAEYIALLLGLLLARYAVSSYREPSRWSLSQLSDPSADCGDLPDDITREH